MSAAEKQQPEHTIAFLRMAAIEIRRMLAQEWAAFPDHEAAKLRHIADECDEEADERVGDTGNSCRRPAIPAVTGKRKHL